VLCLGLCILVDFHCESWCSIFIYNFFPKKIAEGIIFHQEETNCSLHFKIDKNKVRIILTFCFYLSGVKFMYIANVGLIDVKIVKDMLLLCAGFTLSRNN
jgi:hypothetical protein